MSNNSLWGRFREWRHKRQIDRHRKGIKNRFGQGEDRQNAIRFFQKLGGRDGHLGLLERYMVNVDPAQRDEEEKQSVFDALCEFGIEIVGAIEEYLNRKDAPKVPVAWALKVLSAVAPPDEAVRVIIGALVAIGTSYTKEPERKVALITQLSEYSLPPVVPALLPFLRDHRDEVQLEALAALTRLADEAAREPMLELLVDPETPVRVRAQIADAFQKLNWPVRGYRNKVEEALPEGLSIDRSGHIKGRSRLPGLEAVHEEG